jgi:uncharacterized RDD family membrane protein YckC
MDDRPVPQMTMHPHVPSDEELGELVRTAASEWTMPPQRLGERTWRDRVRAERGHRVGLPARWALRATRALVGALRATVVLALVAVLLTLPRTPPAAPAASAGAALPSGPSASATSPASASPVATPLPALELHGALPSPSRLVVGSGSAYQVLDLASGTLGVPFEGSTDTYSPLLARPGGGYVMLATASVTSAATDGVRVTVRTYDAQGRPVAAFVPGGSGGTFVGRADPAVSGSAADQGSSAAIDGSLSGDGRYLYLGWTERVPPVWRSGIDVVDMASGAIAQTVALPDVASSQAGGAIYASVPHVVEAPDARHVVVRASLVREATGVTAWWSAPLNGGVIGPLTPFATGAGTLDTCTENSMAEGFATTGTYFAICDASGDPVVLRRVDLSGRPIGDTALPGLSAGQLPGEIGVVLDRSRRALYAWGPFTDTLVRVDLASGAMTGHAALPRPSASDGDPLSLLGSIARGIGRWLAPVAAAKMYLQPAIAIAPDGTRLYALGVNGTSPLDAGAGSSGVWVFDTSSLAIQGHWTPTADYISVAVSADGAVVYAAGMSGVDASGTQGSQQASVTAFDATTGSIRVIAGRLGDAFLDLSPGLSPAYP